MRVLVMIHQLWRGGGTETHVLTLCSVLRRMGHAVTVYTAGGPWVRKAKSLGIPVHRDPSMHSSPKRSAMRLRQFLVRHRFDVIHAHDGPTVSVAVLALRPLKRRPRLVFTVHGPYVGHVPLKMAKQTAHTIIAVSPALQRYASRFGLGKSKITVIPNGIRTDVFRPVSKKLVRAGFKLPSEAYVVGYAGRFTIEKAQLGRRVVGALRHFTEHRPNVYILVAGRGSNRVIASAGHLKVLGHVNNMRMFYSACDVVIGTARVAAESVSCAVPTLALGTAGYHGLITRRNFAQMVRTNFGDHGSVRPWTTAKLSTELRHALSHREELRREARRTSQTLRRTLDADRMVRRILQTYH
ncbi:glycosyltransferase [Alicyclobacillus mengziensis]|uniref:Glycosyltransferase n=1 Tax=Alicyclobacillus mengziensis TaxID=2931921 RepID=A0A9X7Z5Z2_9BACL|nr:glycosyltransferase [Alicyclobacillus mengziensis]QSO46862.1 glycosyltransferase [Alicyclobacillus mengziensis]